jgi:hypothetical protein
MKYYISIVDDQNVETILTKPTDRSIAYYTVSKWKTTLYMEGLRVNEYGNGVRYKALMKAQSKKRKKARKLTVGEVAEIISDLNQGSN